MAFRAGFPACDAPTLARLPEEEFLEIDAIGTALRKPLFASAPDNDRTPDPPAALSPTSGETEACLRAGCRVPLWLSAQAEPEGHWHRPAHEAGQSAP